MNLRSLRSEDAAHIETLLASAFGGGTEGRLVSLLRADGDMAFEMVADEGDIPCGYIAFARLKNPEGWWSLSPVAVNPARQGRGIGGELIRYGLDHARRAGAKAVTVLGDPDYYARFGFTRKAAEKLRTPFAGPWYMLYPIAPRTAGSDVTVDYPPTFDIF